ncbi:uncharacterized protein CEXT_214141 [Caerostris extrusa]|uniref:Uncharacterized protein n=1 Tax=Caerostris extrusa TaxID=172846 RepID=A0AAV4Y4Q4_CAEEX|nr:uncharacterized protein CEXT_214141 [Caerostris extrusa]
MRPKNGKYAALEINNEIHSVYEYCLAAGLTHDEIAEKARPLLQPIRVEVGKKYLLMILKISLCCLALSYTLSSDTISRSILTQGRYFMFKILEFWDWTEIYSETCLLGNPYYNDEHSYVVDCQACEDVFDVDFLNSTTTEEMSQNYIQKNIPVIVRNAMTDWPIMNETFTIRNLTDEFFFLEDDVCMFQSNLKIKNHRKLFELLSKHEAEKWYAHLLRRFYSRPYFMPPTVQMTESNWLFMSAFYNGKKFKKIDPMPSITVMWVAQVWGTNQIQFKPKKPCHKTCNVLEDTLEEGELVLYNPAVWSFGYLPDDETENLALAAGGFSHFS